MTRVLVVGNSVALYTRPRQTGTQPYGRILESLLREKLAHEVVVEVWAENSLTAARAVNVFEDRIVAWSPDVLVLNLGIVDCTPRIVPQPLRRRFVRGRSRWQRVWLAAEGLVRRPIVRMSGGAPTTSVRAFEAALARLISVGTSEAGARVYCLGLAATSPRLEREVPGVQRQISMFDGAIRRACQRGSAYYVDAETILASGGPDRLRPDGVHFSAEGHAIVANELAQQIMASMSSSPSCVAAVHTETRPPGLQARLAAAVAAGIMAPLALLWIASCRAWRLVRGDER